MQTAMRHLRNEDMTATNWNLAFERLDALRRHAFIWTTSRVASTTWRARRVLATERFATANPSRSGEACATQKNGRDRFSLSRPKLNRTLRQSQSPGAASMRRWSEIRALGTIVSPATSTMGSPVPAATHGSPALARTRTPNRLRHRDTVRISSDAGRWEVRKRRGARAIEARPCCLEGALRI